MEEGPARRLQGRGRDGRLRLPHHRHRPRTGPPVRRRVLLRRRGPVGLADYLRAMEVQSIAGQQATEEDVRKAFHDLLVADEMLEKLGPAINSGRGMFLSARRGTARPALPSGSRGASAITSGSRGRWGSTARSSASSTPAFHEERRRSRRRTACSTSPASISGGPHHPPDGRGGGELTMAELEVTQNPQTHILRSPAAAQEQLRGRSSSTTSAARTMPVDVLLNRWIVPLEKRYDYLNLPSGKKIQVPSISSSSSRRTSSPRTSSTGVPAPDPVQDPGPRSLPRALHEAASTSWPPSSA